MPQSLSKLYVHLIFSTRRRERLLVPSVRGPCTPTWRQCSRTRTVRRLKIGSTSDHTHLLFRLSKNLALADVVERAKTSSSRWLKTQAKTLQSFHWQNGYGGFSVCPVEVDSVGADIEGQEEPHRMVRFQDEYRRFLKEYGVEYDEGYVWH